MSFTGSVEKDLSVLPLLKQGLCYIGQLKPLLLCQRSLSTSGESKWSDCPDEMAGINHGQIFDTCFLCLCRAENLHDGVNLYRLQFLAVGTVVHSRWVALTLKIVETVWIQYFPLPKHSPEASRERRQGCSQN